MTMDDPWWRVSSLFWDWRGYLSSYFLFPCSQADFFCGEKYYISMDSHVYFKETNKNNVRDKLNKQKLYGVKQLSHCCWGTLPSEQASMLSLIGWCVEDRLPLIYITVLPWGWQRKVSQPISTLYIAFLFLGLAYICYNYSLLCLSLPMPPEVDITNGVKTPCSISLTLWPYALFFSSSSVARGIRVKDPNIEESVLSSSPEAYS